MRLRREVTMRLLPVVLLPPAALLVLSACTGGDTDPEAGGSGRSPAASAAVTDQTDLADLDLTDLEPVRGPFCDAIDPQSVEDVLGGPATSTYGYGSGEDATLAPGLTDVAHEFSCAFTRGRTTARAWVFAAPVTAGEAADHLAARAAERGCRRTGELAFGSPGGVLSCAGSGPGGNRVSMAGLFGDAWVTCQVAYPTSGPTSGPTTGQVEAAQRWCAGVVAAMSA